MHASAEQFLSLKAFGAPPVVIALAAHALVVDFWIRRRLYMPLILPFGCRVLATYLAILDMLLIFTFGFGISGAAIATVTSEALAVLMTMTLATSMAARQGPVPMGGRQICMQVWLSMSLLTDALALAGQALLVGDYSQGNYEQARLIVYRVLQIGLGTGIALSMILFPGFGAFSSLFSTDSEVLEIA